MPGSAESHLYTLALRLAPSDSCLHLRRTLSMLEPGE